MYLGIIDGIRQVYYELDAKKAEKDLEKFMKKAKEENEKKREELRNLMTYKETVDLASFCVVNADIYPDLKSFLDKKAKECGRDINEVKENVSIHRAARIGSQVAMSVIMMYQGKLKEGILTWPQEQRIAQTALLRFFKMPDLEDYDDLGDVEIPDITEYMVLDNEHGIFIDDKTIEFAFQIVSENDKTKKLISNIKKGIFVIVDNGMIDILNVNDREILLSCLFALADTETELTDLQRLFISSVRNRLEKKYALEWSVLKRNDWSIVEDISGIEAKKAFVQVLMEFLFLGYEYHENKFKDLFDCLELEQKELQKIRTRIDGIYHVLGLQYIAEQYGKVHYGASGELAYEEINTDITVSNEEEFKDKKLIFNAKIRVMEGAYLCFENCEIYVGDISGEAISLPLCFEERESHTTVRFENCTIHHQRMSDYFIKCKGKWEREAVDDSTYIRAIFTKCDFDKCQNLIAFRRDNEDSFSYLEIEDSRVNVGTGRKAVLFQCDTLDFKNSVFFTEKDAAVEEDCFYHAHNIKIEGCYFVNLAIRYSLLRFGITYGFESSVFEQCSLELVQDKEMEKGELYEWWTRQCIFKTCYFKGSVFDKKNTSETIFMSSKFQNCTGKIETGVMDNVIVGGGCLFIQTVGSLELIDCSFSDLSYRRCEEDGLPEYIDETVLIQAGYGCKILGCAFENLQLEDRYLIGRSAYYCKIGECKFHEIQSSKGILKFDNSGADFNIYNCSGLYLAL